MPSRRAITLFDAPSASSARTSSSRGVSGTSPSANGETAGGRDHGCIGGLAGTDQPQTRHAREQCGEPVGQRRVLDDERQSDRAWCGVFAQAAGLSAMVSDTCFVSPARRRPDRDRLADAVRPEGAQDDCTCRIGSPFQSMIDVALVARPPRLLALEDRRSSPWRPIRRRSPPRAEAEAEIAARDAPVALKPRGDALNRGRRDDEHPAARPEYRHADRPAGCIEGEPAFGARAARQIKLNAGVDLAAAQGSARVRPSGTRRRARRSARPLRRPPLWRARRPRRVRPQAEPARRSERSMRSKAMSVVGSRPTSLAGLCRRPGSVTAILAFLRQGLVGGDDEPGPPDEAARPRPVGVDRNHPSRGARDDPGDFGGEVFQQ